ncbi:MAG: DsbA family protein [Alphaproteobacteria bacterium]|nr:DsbA family protein [Alphaproteobacteria bacterium]
MHWIFRGMALAVLAFVLPSAGFAEERILTEHILGDPKAPVRVDEYMSITCSHCADFFINTLPKIQKRYIDTGKVYFVVHDFPLNGLSLKSAAIAHCMPKDEYFAFIKTLYMSMMERNFGGAGSEAKLYQFAALGGLPKEKAKACANDPKIHEALIKDRTDAETRYQIEATPTFVINYGADVINGAQGIDAFAAILDRAIASKKASKN